MGALGRIVFQLKGRDMDWTKSRGGLYIIAAGAGLLAPAVADLGKSERWAGDVGWGGQPWS